MPEVWWRYYKAAETVADKVFTEDWPEQGRIQVAGVVVALDAFLFSHHHIQAVVLCAGRRVLVYYLTQVTSKRCMNTQSASVNTNAFGDDS